VKSLKNILLEVLDYCPLLFAKLFCGYVASRVWLLCYDMLRLRYGWPVIPSWTVTLFFCVLIVYRDVFDYYSLFVGLSSFVILSSCCVNGVYNIVARHCGWTCMSLCASATVVLAVLCLLLVFTLNYIVLKQKENKWKNIN
jgi:hypothetical protein